MLKVSIKTFLVYEKPVIYLVKLLNKKFKSKKGHSLVKMDLRKIKHCGALKQRCFTTVINCNEKLVVKKEIIFNN